MIAGHGSAEPRAFSPGCRQRRCVYRSAEDTTGGVDVGEVVVAPASPLIFAFCFFPIVLRALRVAAALTAAFARCSGVSTGERCAWNPKLASFGFQAHRSPVLTPEQRAKAAVKAAATRKARNTMGKKQKAKIKGDAGATTTSPTSTPPVVSSADR